MSSQLSNSLAIPNVSILTAHLKAVGNSMNLFSNSSSPPPLLKVKSKEGSKSLLNYSDEYSRSRSNYLNLKNWNQFNFNYETNSSENFLTENYLSQYLGQYKNFDYNSSLKIVDYSNNLVQNYEKNKLDDQALDLSKSNKNQQKNIKQEEIKKKNLPIKMNKRPSSLPNQSKSFTQIKKKNISSVKKPIRKMIFDEHKSSPVSGTFILSEEDAKLCATFINSDIDSALVTVTPEAIAKLEKIENQIGDYLCKLCFLKFEDAFKLAQHTCSRIGHYIYTCPKCGDKKYNNPANLASHARWCKGNKEKKLSSSLNTSLTSLTNIDIKSPTGKCSPKLIIDSNERIQKTIKLEDQIVSVSVIQDSVDNQVKISNNKVKVAGTAIIPEQSDLSLDEKSINNELTNKVTKEVDLSLKDKLNDYCPKKFRRHQYLISKSPMSENQENEMINCNTSFSENEEISSSSEAEISQTNLILQRKKRALSSVTTDENNLQLIKTEDVEEQVFTEQNSQESSNNFESQKKFLISKKLKSEQN